MEEGIGSSQRCFPHIFGPLAVDCELHRDQFFTKLLNLGFLRLFSIVSILIRSGLLTLGVGIGPVFFTGHQQPPSITSRRHPPLLVFSCWEEWADGTRAAGAQDPEKKIQRHYSTGICSAPTPIDEKRMPQKERYSDNNQDKNSKITNQVTVLGRTATVPVSKTVAILTNYCSTHLVF